MIAGFLIQADAIVPCRLCGAEEGEPCKRRPKDKTWGPGFVHFGRRMKRILLSAGAPTRADKDKFEADAVKLLEEFMAEKKRAKKKGRRS